MITTFTGGKKIEGNDNWRQIFGAHNDSVTAYDGHVDAIQEGLAIVAEGDVHAAVASGQFVYVRNHDTLSEGLYKATAAIAVDGALTSSNLTACSSGGMNDLKSSVDTLNSNLANTNITAPRLLNAQNDMNNVTEGIYFQRFGSTAMPANAPSSKYNAMIICAHAGETGLVQYWHCLNTGELLYRQLEATGGTWSAWRSFVLSSALNPKGTIESNKSVTITPGRGDGPHTLTLKRGSTFCAVVYDWWTSGYTTMAGTVPSSITITKNASTNDVTVSNTGSSAIAYDLS